MYLIGKTHLDLQVLGICCHVLHIFSKISKKYSNFSKITCIETCGQSAHTCTKKQILQICRTRMRICKTKERMTLPTLIVGYILQNDLQYILKTEAIKFQWKPCRFFGHITHLGMQRNSPRFLDRITFDSFCCVFVEIDLFQMLVKETDVSSIWFAN